MRWSISLLASLALLAAPAGAHAAPANDNYLASTIIKNADGSFPTTWSATADTTSATSQADLFQPDRDGQPLGGGPPEPSACGGMGKTVWYDIVPPVDGGVEVTAQGFDTTVAVYEYDARSSQITRQLACAATPGQGETLTLPEEVRAGKNYTVQVGGAPGPDGQPLSGPLAFGFSFFGDRDGDGVLDALPDRCPDLAGVGDFGGCPPTLRPSVTYTYGAASGGVRLAKLTVAKAPRGAKIRVIGGGTAQTATVPADGKLVTFGRFAGRALRSGSSLKVQVTRGNGAGIYRHGAIGVLYAFPVRGSKIGQRTDRCLLPGQTTPRKSCRKPSAT